MATWVFEPGHTAAEFRARHMMVCWVRGHVEDVHGCLEFDPDNPTQLTIDATIDANSCGPANRSGTNTCAALIFSTLANTRRSASRAQVANA